MSPRSGGIGGVSQEVYKGFLPASSAYDEIDPEGGQGFLPAHFPWTSQRHDEVGVNMDRLTKSAHFLAMRMTFTLEELYRLYIREIVRLHGMLVSIVSNRGSSFYGSVLEEFPEGHGDTVFDEYRFTSLDRWSIRADYLDFRGHAASMRSGSQG